MLDKVKGCNKAFSFHIFTFFSVTLCCIFGLACNAAAQKVEEDELSHFLHKIETASDSFTSFNAKFRQEKELSLFSKPMVFHGEIIVQRPDKLRWQFTAPVPSVLLLDGKRGMRCSKGAPPVEFDLATDPVMRSVAEQLWLWLGGDYVRLKESFAIEKTGPATLTIKPKDKGVAGFIETVTIAFDEKSMQPRRVEIAEPGGDLTRLLFTSYIFGADTTPGTFRHCSSTTEQPE